MTGLIEEIMNGFWMMEQKSAQSYIPLISNLIQGNLQIDPAIDFAAERLKNKTRFISLENEIFTISDYGRYNSPAEAPENSIALMQLHGAITYHDQSCGPAGMSTKSSIVNQISLNKNILALVIDIRSGGGELYASSKFVRAISDLQIPVIAFIEDLAASAAYQIAASCDWIVANTPQAQIGSVGTYVTIADFEKALEMAGIKLTEIYATKSIDKNQDYKEALKGNTSKILESVDFVNESMIAEIQNNREGKLVDEKIWGTGKVFFAEEALKNGMIDEISSFNDMIQSLAYSLTTN